MYLKSIEIQGFKSFANKIKLEFQDGFTAIVGPNGSGKSNVADAVRWVLGEQRVKQLRGGSMQDVIFAGTELRKPLSSAYVAITLDNSDHRLPVDYEEVTIARRLYRSGESEYILNGVQVRLKDVQELFYDTGIGREGYSIIGQGQVEKILSDKPEDRRELFDEAAGIVKYKTRKNASVRKLENEKANLVRITDILSELEKQVGPLEEQSRKAQVYLHTREELKVLDTNIFLIENSRTTNELHDVESRLEIAVSDLEQAGVRYEETKTRYAELQTEIEDLEGRIEAARNQITQASIVRNHLEGNIRLFEEQIRSAQTNAQHYHTRADALRHDIDDKKEERETIVSSKTAIDTEMAGITGSLGKAAEELSAIGDQIDDLTNQINDKRALVLEILNGRTELKARQARLKERTEQFEIRQSELSAKLISASSDEAEHEETLSSLRANFERIAGEAADLGERDKQIDAELADCKRQLTSTDEQLRSAETEYHQEKSKLDALQNLTERYEGFGGAVKRVMEEKSREKGLIGVVADLIKTEPRYETAMETALGGSIQNVVTQDEDTAKRMIALLKRERCGRATFLPLTTIRGAQPFNMTGVLAEPGIIGLADSLVRVAPEYRDVAISLLGRIVVADTFDHAAAAERKFQHKLRMVTLDGELFTPGGAISGGTFRNNSNLLGRRREIDGLRKSVHELQERIEAFNESIDTIKQHRNQLRIDKEQVRTALQSKFIEQNTARMSIGAEEAAKKASAEGYASLVQENQSIEGTRASLQAEAESIQADLQSSVVAETEANQFITIWNKQLEDLRVQEEEKSRVVSDWELTTAQKRKTQEFMGQELSRIDGELARLRAELSGVEENLHAGDAQIAEKQKEIEETQKTIETSHSAKDEGEKQLTEMASQKDQLSREQKECLESRESLSQQKTNLDKEVFRLDSRKQKMEESLESQINYMWAEYELTLTTAEEIRNPELTETDLPLLRKDAADRKSKIKALGDVNVNAIEQYQEISERYEFMRKQRDDIVTAEKNLEDIIAELDVLMRKQFKEQFARIQNEFNKVFKQLFGGGEGRLELLDNEDILEAGVLVIAQPPGKKLQNMMQMSGGEKALTAISLLFAIQNLRPSPFCLLDEIEAALDESNVGRFAQYVHQLTKNTQFIVITHRRGTMDRADRLYGITMQEKGVSTLVSVNLLDDKELTSDTPASA